MLSMIIGVILDAATSVDPFSAFKIGGGVVGGGLTNEAVNRMRQKALNERLAAMELAAKEDRAKFERHIESHSTAAAELAGVLARMDQRLYHIEQALKIGR